MGRKEADGKAEATSARCGGKAAAAPSSASAACCARAPPHSSSTSLRKSCAKRTSSPWARESGSRRGALEGGRHRLFARFPKSLQIYYKFITNSGNVLYNFPLQWYSKKKIAPPPAHRKAGSAPEAACASEGRFRTRSRPRIGTQVLQKRESLRIRKSFQKKEKVFGLREGPYARKSC